MEKTLKLIGKRVACLVEEDFEDLELWVPVMRLREEGAIVTLVGSGRQESFHGKYGIPAKPEVNADKVRAENFDALIIPGGWAPDKLRRFPVITNLVRSMYLEGKIIGTICHGGWVLISAGIVEGHKATGTVAIKDDLINAGAVWVDESAIRDGNLVWGRVVEDIPNYCRLLVEALAE